MRPAVAGLLLAPLWAACALSAPLTMAEAAECACVDASSTLSVGEDGCVPATTARGHNVTQHCLPAGYGSVRCAAWDASVRTLCPVDATGALAAACGAEWCYVDYEACRRSQFTIERSVLFADTHELYFSYSFCSGTVAARSRPWAAAEAEATSEGLLMAASAAFGVHAGVRSLVPALSYPFLYRDASTAWDASSDTYLDDSLPMYGAIASYVARVIEVSGGGSVMYTHVSTAARAAHGSAYTAAIADLARGLGGAAFGDFWVTPERTALVPFSVPLYSDEIWLFVKDAREESGLWSNAAKVFQPFALETWLMLLGVAVVVGQVQSWFDLPSRPTRAVERLRELDGRADSKAKARLQRRLSGAIRSTETLKVVLDEWGWGDFMLHAVDRTYVSVNELLGADVGALQAREIPSRFLKVGWALFVVVIMSTYTANLAAFLSSNDVKLPIASLHDLHSQGGSACTMAAIKDSLEKKFPLSRFHGYSDEMGALAGYEAGVCQGVVLSLVTADLSFPVQERMCALQLIAVDKVHNVQVAFGLSDATLGFSGWMEAARKNEGVTWESYIVAHKRAARVCELRASVLLGLAVLAGSAEATQFRPEHFASLAMVLVGCAIAGAVAKLLLQRQGLDAGEAAHFDSFKLSTFEDVVRARMAVEQYIAASRTSKGNQVGALADKNDVTLAAAMRGGDGEAVAAASPALRAGSSAACNKVAPLKDPADLRGLPI